MGRLLVEIAEVVSGARVVVSEVVVVAVVGLVGLAARVAIVVTGIAVGTRVPTRGSERRVVRGVGSNGIGVVVGAGRDDGVALRVCAGVAIRSEFFCGNPGGRGILWSNGVLYLYCSCHLFIVNAYYTYSLGTQRCLFTKAAVCHTVQIKC